MQYRREIDGLRAIAVLPVIAFHAGFVGFSGGYVGVDVFFVISGYLITSILLKDLAQEQFSILRFYERRARRILPALVTVVLVSLPFAYAWMLPTAFKDYTQSIAAVALFASNILFWMESGYFEAAAEEKPLLHTWSLAVEEQYYLIFPILLFLLWRFGPRSVFWTIAAMALVSLGLAEWGSRHAPSANFFLLPTRMWELFAGSLCALHLHRTPVRGQGGIAAFGLGLVIISVAFLDAETPFPSLWTLPVVGGTVLIILFAWPGTFVARLLGTKVLVGIGLISYSAYLWHQPIFAFARIRSLFAPEPWLMAILALLSFILAALTWAFVEQPFRRRPNPLLAQRKTLFATSALVMAVLFGFGLWGHMSDGRKMAWEQNLPAETRAIYARIETAKQLEQAQSFDFPDDGRCRFALRGNIDAITRRRLSECRDTFGPGIAIIGDSHAIDIFRSVIRTDSQTPFLFGLFVFGNTSHPCRDSYTGDGCPFADLLQPSGAPLFAQIIFTEAGRYLLETSEGVELSRPNITGIAITEMMIAAQPSDQRINRAAAYLELLDRQSDTIWLGPRVEPHLPIDFLAQAGCAYPHQLRPGQLDTFLSVENAIARRLKDTGITMLSQIDLAAMDFTQDILSCKAVFWADGDHFSDAGEDRFGQRMRLLEVVKTTHRSTENDG